MDRGSWIIAAGICLVVGILFFGTVNARLETAYRIPSMADYYDPAIYEMDPDSPMFARSAEQSADRYKAALDSRKTVPVFGDRFQRYFRFDPSGSYRPALAISVFYVPLAILCIHFRRTRRIWTAFSA